MEFEVSVKSEPIEIELQIKNDGEPEHILLPDWNGEITDSRSADVKTERIEIEIKPEDCDQEDCDQVNEFLASSYLLRDPLDERDEKAINNEIEVETVSTSNGPPAKRNLRRLKKNNEVRPKKNNEVRPKKNKEERPSKDRTAIQLILKGYRQDKHNAARKSSRLAVNKETSVKPQQETNVSGINEPQEEQSRLQIRLLKEGRTKCKKCRGHIRNELLDFHLQDCNKTKMTVTKSKTYNKNFKCRICERNFGYDDERYLGHINSHRALGIMYLCSCGEKFSKKEKYKIHSCGNKKRTCTEHKGKYYCDTCDKVYVNLFIYSLHTCKEPETKINESATASSEIKEEDSDDDLETLDSYRLRKLSNFGSGQDSDE